MPLSRLEKVAAGLIVLSGLSMWGGDTAAQHFRSQIKITSQVARADELRKEMGDVASIVHNNFYRRDPKGYDRPIADYLNPENRQAISEAWADYDKLKAEYDRVVSQPEVRELIEKNEKLRDSVTASYGISGTVAITLFGAAFITYLASLKPRDKNVNYAEAQPASPQGSH